MLHHALPLGSVTLVPSSATSCRLLRQAPGDAELGRLLAEAERQQAEADAAGLDEGLLQLYRPHSHLYGEFL